MWTRWLVDYVTTDFYPYFFVQETKGDSKNAKKKNNKKTSKNKSSLSRTNKKKPGMPNVSNDLSQKLYATMEKHKEVLKIFKLSFMTPDWDNWNISMRDYFLNTF